MNPVARLVFAHLRSFRREAGAPYDQYVWLYSRIYAAAMKVIHRAGFCWLRARPLGGRHCDWCGAHKDG